MQGFVLSIHIQKKTLVFENFNLGKSLQHLSFLCTSRTQMQREWKIWMPQELKFNLRVHKDIWDIICRLFMNPCLEERISQHFIYKMKPEGNENAKLCRNAPADDKNDKCMCALNCIERLGLLSLHTEELGPWLSLTVYTLKLNLLHRLYKGQFLTQAGEISIYNSAFLIPVYNWCHKEMAALYFQCWLMYLWPFPLAIGTLSFYFKIDTEPPCGHGKWNHYFK